MDMTSSSTPSMEELAGRVRAAMDSVDLKALAATLHSDVRWGPPGGPSTCRNKQDVVAWYTRAVGEGRRGTVTGIEVVGDALVVGLVVDDPTASKTSGRLAQRWQVLAVRDGLVADIRGFEDHAEALAAAGAGAGGTGQQV